MGKPVNPGQALQILSVLALNTDWSQFDADEMQAQIVNKPKDAGAAFTAWLKNGCRLSVKGPNTLVIDRSHPFDPVKFIGQGWGIDEKEDERSLALTDIDFSKIRFDSGLKEGESRITGEEKLKRLKNKPEIRLDAKIGQALYEEKGQATLRWLHDTYKVDWLELAGTVLRYPHGYRYFLCLSRDDGGSWCWNCYWLDDDRSAQGVSPVSAS